MPRKSKDCHKNMFFCLKAYYISSAFRVNLVNNLSGTAHVLQQMVLGQALLGKHCWHRRGPRGTSSPPLAGGARHSCMHRCAARLVALAPRIQQEAAEQHVAAGQIAPAPAETWGEAAFPHPGVLPLFLGVLRVGMASSCLLSTHAS